MFVAKGDLDSVRATKDEHQSFSVQVCVQPLSKGTVAPSIQGGGNGGANKVTRHDRQALHRQQGVRRHSSLSRDKYAEAGPTRQSACR